MYCKKCGKQLAAEDIYCPYCGCKSAVLEKNEPKWNQFFRENKRAICIVGLFLIIGAATVSYNIYQKSEEDKLWREYRLLQAQGEQGNVRSDIDFSSLHKYENSTYKIGDTMPAGEYVLFATSGNGYFELSSDSLGDSIICNENFEYNSIITVNRGEYLKLSRCYAEPIDSAGDVSTSGTGMFKIGTHLSAGEYKLEATGTASAYYCIYGDGRQDDIVDNDNFEGTAYVTVRNGQYLLLSRCKISK